MKRLLYFLAFFPLVITAQDLTQGLLVNDLTLRPMVEAVQPGYLDTIVDPSFGTTIRRITDAAPGGVIVPMYSTVQAWNADESLLILYNQTTSRHELLDGRNYQPVRTLTDIDPLDLEQLFWDFDDPEILYYPDRQTSDLIRYNPVTQAKEVLVNLAQVSGCSDGIALGNNIQMPSRDNDLFTFRCGNTAAYACRLSSGTLTTFALDDVQSTAPAAAPSGNRFYHRNKVYDANGNEVLTLNKSTVEHACLGRLGNGNDAYYAIAFAQGPQGGCIGDIIAHDLTTGTCTPLISQSQGYDYPQSGTHLSALAHRNTESGWLAASMIGYDQDGQALLDQELVIARLGPDGPVVCRIGHHRSDETEFDYWGEPHAVISPTGTRVLFGSDWSGAADGQSVNSYVVELPAYQPNATTATHVIAAPVHQLFPNPVTTQATLVLPAGSLPAEWRLYDATGRLVQQLNLTQTTNTLSAAILSPGIYFYRISGAHLREQRGRFVKQ